LYAYLTKFEMITNRNISIAPFRIGLVAPDPIVYDNTSGSVLTATVNKYVGGGVTWPLVWPLEWEAGSGATTVNNTGNVAVYPAITINGSATNPIITNTTSGEFIQLDSLTAPVGSEIIINPRVPSVTLNGGNIFTKVNSASTWWKLNPGNNSLKLTTSDAADTAVATVEWRSGYLGV
jgi:ABC-type uncharacterized transport system permease subunit